MRNQLNKGARRRLMYLENKDGSLDGVAARIGWAEFSKTGRSVFYRDRELKAIAGGGIRGNFIDVATGEEYWISGVKKRGSNTHWAESTRVEIDPDALDEYNKVKAKVE